MGGVPPPQFSAIVNYRHGATEDRHVSTGPSRRHLAYFFSFVVEPSMIDGQRAVCPIERSFGG